MGMPGMYSKSEIWWERLSSSDMMRRLSNSTTRVTAAVLLLGALSIIWLVSRSGVGSVGPRVDAPLFSWTIFITPQDFIDGPARSQRRAIHSWTLLDPRPKIVLLGHGAGFADVASDYDCIVDAGIDMNLVDMPLAGSLLERAMRADTDVAVILNSDILLSQSFVEAVVKVRAQFEDWFLMGARLDLLSDLPPAFEPSQDGFSDAAFQSYARTKGVLHTAGGVDYFAWNVNRGRKLIQSIMPPFIRGKSKFDNWIVHEVIAAGYRNVIDGTEAVVAVHVNHDYKAVDGSQAKLDGLKPGATFWQRDKNSNWQIFHNVHLALHHGSYRNQDGTTVHAPWKLVDCVEPEGSRVCLVKRLRPGICPCEHNAFSLATQSDPEVVEVFEREKKRHLIKCGAISVDKEDVYTIPVQTREGHAAVFGLPFTLSTLLPLVARKNHVIVTGLNYAYRDMLMNFVCNLRRLGLYDTLVIAAFDEDMYRFGFKMGLPVFYYESMSALLDKDMAYGSRGFKQITKLKSQVVLQILKLGYDVTWTDSDIVWFQNPLPLLDKMPSNFVVQSNAPSSEPAANGPLRINSGFYRVRSTAATIAAMEAIVAHAAASQLTEQPSFYIVLCGGKDGAFREGDSRCVYRADAGDGSNDEPQENVPVGGAPEGPALTVTFLDRDFYPAGAWKNLWDSPGIKDNTQLVILHNNWIKGLEAKTQRLMTTGMWWYNRGLLVCSYEPAPRFVLDWSIEKDGLHEE